MRYIANSEGYITEVSFGTEISCGDQICTVYEGSIPTGYQSLESWYLVEYETLYRWKIVDGELTLDAEAEAPVDTHVIHMNSNENPYIDVMHGDSTGCHHIEPYYSSDGSSGFIVYNDGVAYLLSMASTGLFLRYYDQSSGQFIDYTLDGSGGSSSGSGGDGVGILSVEQTTTSTADGGNNVITVTLTDGTKSTFTVKNGTKGTAGADGKSAYAYAQDGGYTGTEAEFAAKLAEETPGIHIGAEAPTDDSVLWVDTDEEAEEESAEAVPSDWNAAEGEPGHVLNRPFYKETVELINGTAVDADGQLLMEADIEFVAGKTYTVTYNGVEYTCTAFAFEADGMTIAVIGNGAALGLDDTGEPFAMLIMDGMLACMDMNGATEATIRIMGEKVFPIPREYLPPMSYVIDVEDKTATSNSKMANITYDTTELVQFLKNGWPVWLNITGGSVDKRVQVTAWYSLGITIDEQIANGISPAAVMLYLYGNEIDLAKEYKWVVGLNMTD